jgi:Protein of unknown function (DUF3224)
MQMRSLVMTAAGLCATATITIGTLRPASGDEGRRVQFADLSPVTATDFNSAYPADVSRCSFTNIGNVTSPCVAPVTPTGSFDDSLTGDFVGTGHFVGGAVLTVLNDLPTSDVPFESYEPYSLRIAGCGTGSLILHTEGNLNTGNGVWQIVPDSGRGDLLGISGSGTSSAGAPNTNGTTPGIFVGHVRCRAHG